MAIVKIKFCQYEDSFTIHPKICIGALIKDACDMHINIMG